MKSRPLNNKLRKEILDNYEVANIEKLRKELLESARKVFEPVAAETTAKRQEAYKVLKQADLQDLTTLQSTVTLAWPIGRKCSIQPHRWGALFFDKSKHIKAPVYMAQHAVELRLNEISGEMHEQLNAIDDERIKLDNDLATLRRVLHGCRTTKQLVDSCPDIEQYLPATEAKTCLISTEDVKAVNELLSHA